MSGSDDSERSIMSVSYQCEVNRVRVGCQCHDISVWTIV